MEASLLDHYGNEVAGGRADRQADRAGGASKVGEHVGVRRLGASVESAQGMEVGPVEGGAVGQVRSDAVGYYFRRFVAVVEQVDRAYPELLATGERGAPGTWIVPVRSRSRGAVRQQNRYPPVRQHLPERHVVAGSGERRFYRVGARIGALHDVAEQRSAAVGACEVGAERIYGCG